VITEGFEMTDRSKCHFERSARNLSSIKLRWVPGRTNATGHKLTSEWAVVYALLYETVVM
jgi:hypothetical protein